MSDGSGDTPTIQDAIVAAADGDTVMAHQGVYHENLDFLGKQLVVRSRSGPVSTVIDGNGVGSCVSFVNGEGRGSELQGFTLLNGTGTISSSGATRGGGGIYILNSEPSILHNIITENSAVGAAGGAGGGIYAFAPGQVAWAPLMEGNAITNNVSGTIGGGIQATGKVAPEIRNNRIEANQAVDGGGVMLWSWMNGAIITNNVIKQNTASDHGGGLIVSWSQGTPDLQAEVSWNLIAGNIAKATELANSSGGGILLTGTDAWVHHNTIADNEGLGADSTWGGNIVVEIAGNPLIERNIIAFAKNGGGIFCRDATPTIRDNLNWMNGGGAGAGSCIGWSSINGNIVANPLFCDHSGGEYSVAANSPVLSAFGDPIGAIPLPGCGPVAAQRITWGQLKMKFWPARKVSDN